MKQHYMTQATIEILNAKNRPHKIETDEGLRISIGHYVNKYNKLQEIQAEVDTWHSLLNEGWDTLGYGYGDEIDTDKAKVHTRSKPNRDNRISDLKKLAKKVPDVAEALEIATARYKSLWSLVREQAEDNPLLKSIIDNLDEKHNSQPEYYTIVIVGKK